MGVLFQEMSLGTGEEILGHCFLECNVNNYYVDLDDQWNLSTMS